MPRRRRPLLERRVRRAEEPAATKQLQGKLDGFAKLQSTWNDLFTICEMAVEENDESLLDELKTVYAAFESALEQARLQTCSPRVRREQRDPDAAPRRRRHGGAGLASMLYRMYTRWAERHGYKCTLMDWQDGDEAGIKSATIRSRVRTPTVFEERNGVHRLVRISPFDASARRQTSFAAWRSCRRSRTTPRSSCATRTSRWTSTAPPAPAGRRSTRPPPPSG